MATTAPRSRSSLAASAHVASGRTADRPAAGGHDGGGRAEFLGDLAIYLVINVVLWAAWLSLGDGYAWPVWVSGLWAVALAVDAWALLRRG